MIDEITDFLFGLKMTIISGIFLLIAVIFMIFGIDVPIYVSYFRKEENVYMRKSNKKLIFLVSSSFG